MRYAVYFAPPRWHPLGMCGRSWFDDGAAVDPLRSVPARYGFHATLKAPMVLAEGVRESAFLLAVGALAVRHRAFAMPRLEVARLSDFLALRLVDEIGADHPLRRLADDCVRELDALRTPLTDEERQRQRRPGLSERQRANVEQHGYAHVLDDWRFHMTLSSPLGGVEPVRADALRAQAEDCFAGAIALPLEADAVAVFAEPAPGARFVCLRRFALASR